MTLEAIADPPPVTLDRELNRIVKVCLDVVQALRKTAWSYQRIANATGLLVARIAQVLCDTGSVKRRSATTDTR